MKAPTLFDVGVTFDGKTFDHAKDGARLSTQLERVRELMADGRWRTLAQIKKACGGSEASVSARLRDLRKARFGGLSIERRRYGASAGGLWEYRCGSVAS